MRVERKLMSWALVQAILKWLHLGFIGRVKARSIEGMLRSHERIAGVLQDLRIFLVLLMNTETEYDTVTAFECA